MIIDASPQLWVTTAPVPRKDRLGHICHAKDGAPICGASLGGSATIVRGRVTSVPPCVKCQSILQEHILRYGSVRGKVQCGF